MNVREKFFMQEAVKEARKSRLDPTGRVPCVGAIAVLNNEIIGRAFRGQDPTKPNDHAEFILLESELNKDIPLRDATIYTTLEPCTHRGPGKTPCVDHLLKNKVGRVVIGMLDPNPLILGVGFRKLRAANIPTEVFPYDLMSELEALNRFFISKIENDPIHIMMQKMAASLTRCNDPRQSVAALYHLVSCLSNIQKIESGEIPVIGQETAFFQHWLKRARSYDHAQTVRAYIRLPAFKPEELISKNWFGDFYRNLSEMVFAGKLKVFYIFLLPTPTVTEPIATYFEKIKSFAEEIRVIGLDGQHLNPSDLRPSIVLFENQRFAFTHDRADNSAMLQATEWISKEHFALHADHYQRLELASTVFYRRT